MDYKMFLDLYNDKNKESKIKDEVKDIFDELDEIDFKDTFDEKKDFENDPIEPEIIGVSDPMFENTAEIEVLSLDSLNDDVIETTKEILDDKPKKKRRFLPWTIDEDYHLQRAFVNCAVLGFITMAIGYGELFYIICHI